MIVNSLGTQKPPDQERFGMWLFKDVGNGIWSIGPVEQPKLYKPRKHYNNGAQYAHHYLSHPDESFYSNTIWLKFSPPDVNPPDSAVKADNGHPLAAASNFTETMMVLDGGLKIPMADWETLRSVNNDIEILNRTLAGLEQDQSLSTSDRVYLIEKAQLDLEPLWDYVRGISQNGKIRNFNTDFSKPGDAVYQALQRFYKKVDKELGFPEMANHMREYIYTGNTVAYLPPDDLDRWILE